MKIVVICGMSDEKVRARLLPLVEIMEMQQIYLIRRDPFHMEKIKTHSPPALLKWSLFLSEIYRFLVLFFVCAKEKPSYIYGIYFVPHGIYAAVVGFLLNIPVIQELIGTDRPKVTKLKVFQKLLSSAECVGVRGMTSKNQLYLLGIPKEKIFISNAVNILDFNYFKPTHLNKIFDLIYVGRLDENKQVGNLIDAVPKLCRIKPDLKIVIVGDGPERENLENLTARLNLSTQISFVGQQTSEAIPDFLNQSRIFVMTSAFEGLPVAMIEALSCGLPVVVPKVGDIDDIAIDKYNALLFDKNSLSDLIDSLSYIIGDGVVYQELKAGAVATRDKFIEEYTILNVQETWKKILSIKDM